ncbi:hypothetical protein U3516DRAFT_793423 [Neocallimastix sp. 'constans']
MEENRIIDVSLTKEKNKLLLIKNINLIFHILRKDNSKKKILKYDNSHNHPEKEHDVSLSLMNNKNKDGIEKSSIPFGIKIKLLYNKISKEMGLICPEYNSIKSQISRNLNKELPSNVTTFAEIPNESKYYKAKRVKLFREYNDDIFVDGIFLTYAKELNSFYTTSFAVLKYKEQETNKILFEKLKKNDNTSINKANEISVLIERYKNIETKLIDAKCDRNNTINLCFDCLTD